MLKLLRLVYYYYYYYYLREEGRRRAYKKVTENGEWRRLHNEKIGSLYCSRYVVKIIKSRRLRWEEHLARMEDVGVLSTF